MKRDNSGRATPCVWLEGIRGYAPTPDPEYQFLDPHRELVKSFNAFDRIYVEMVRLVHRMSSLKIYSCDEYEIYDGVNGVQFDWLDWDKVSLALHSAELEVKRIDVLHWMAVRRHTPLPPEVIAIIQTMVLDWKHAVHLTRVEQVEDKHSLRTLIANSGLAKLSSAQDEMSDQSSACPSFATATEVCESIPLASSQAISFALAANSVGGLFQDTDLGQTSFDFEITTDLSADPLMDITFGNPHSENEDFVRSPEHTEPGLQLEN